MSNDTNMDNRILAEFEGIDISEMTVMELEQLKSQNVEPSEVERMATYEDLEYHTDRNALHRVWEKFRELRFDDMKDKVSHSNKNQSIAHAMAYGTLTDLYNAMVQAVKWYNEVAPATEAEYEKGKTKN